MLRKYVPKLLKKILKTKPKSDVERKNVTVRELSKLGVCNKKTIMNAIDLGIRKDPKKLALDISLCRKLNPTRYSELTQALIHYLEENKNIGISSEHKEMLMLASNSPQHSQDGDYAILKSILSSCAVWELSKLFRYPLFNNNHKLLRHFIVDVNSREVFKYLNVFQSYKLYCLAYSTMPDYIFYEFCKNINSSLIKLDYSRKSEKDIEYCDTLKLITSRQTRSKDLRPLPSKLNIAVCISGQLRGFEEASKSWNRLNLDQHNVKWFVHTWDNIGQTYPDTDIVGSVERVFESSKMVQLYQDLNSHLSKSKIETLFPSLTSRLREIKLANSSHIKSIYGEGTIVAIDKESDFSHLNNQDKMHYKIIECFKLCERDEVEFDLVIRIRPDKKIIDSSELDWINVLEDIVSNRVVLTEENSGLRENLIIGDQLQVGTPDMMRDIYHMCEDMKNSGIPHMPSSYTGHSTLAYCCMANGYRTKRLDSLKMSRPVNLEKINDQECKSLLENDMKLSVLDEKTCLLINNYLKS